jgi:hypothetical protein
MPAVTADTLTLPRVTALPESTGRGVVSVTTAPTGYEGEGFPVHRAFAGVPMEMLDPFIHMDQMGEVEYAAGEPKGTPWHPHRGFETFTYLVDGEFIRLIPIEGVVAVWKSPALSSGLAIVDEVSEPTRGSHRGVRVIR